MTHLIAYIDPGSGSFALQAVAGTVLGGIYVVRGRVRLLVAKLKGTKSPEEPKEI